MKPILLHSKPLIESFLRCDPHLHLYALGDLDDFFWPYTTWFGAERDGELESLFLLYSGGGLPVVLAIAGAERDNLRQLVEDSLFLLPRRFYAHFSPGIAETVRAGGYHLEPHGLYLKMALTDPSRLDSVDTSGVVQFHPQDAKELTAFYDAAYPGHWFDPRMLETGCYYGVRQSGRIASVAGIHVYSPRYQAAALGNITTLPEYYGQGFGTRATAALCKALCREIRYIGLNVRADNAPALRVYTRLGFTTVAEYEEVMSEG